MCTYLHLKSIYIGNNLVYLLTTTTIVKGRWVHSPAYTCYHRYNQSPKLFVYLHTYKKYLDRWKISFFLLWPILDYKNGTYKHVCHLICRCRCYDVCCTRDANKKYICFKTRGRHSSVDSSGPTILQCRVRIPSAPSTLL